MVPSIIDVHVWGYDREFCSIQNQFLYLCSGNLSVEQIDGHDVVELRRG
jgi:hypothetical protein